MTDIVSPPEDSAGRIAWARRICHDRRRWSRLVSGKAVVKMAEAILIDAGLPVPVGRARTRHGAGHASGDGGGFDDMTRGEDRVGSAWIDGGGGCD
ncbi:MAG: hypothetical protein O9972_14315 [Burkholderiales bacterium]|nr:hypothetical protein [Burkholderiales bacterium]